MIYIVDGTGCFDNGDYAVSMAGSNCMMIYYLNKGTARYWRGPSDLDIFRRTSGIANAVLQDIMSNEFPPALLAPGERQAPRTPIYLVGYSRGGAAMIMVAKMLAERNIPVAAMFLFDAVDWTTTWNKLETVPGNVEKCYHAVRNEGAEVVMEYEERQLWKKCQQAVGFKEIENEFARVGSGAFENFLLFRSARFPELNRLLATWKVKSESLKNFKVAMRNSYRLGTGDAGPSIPFGNCATKHANIKSWELKQFAGSHGALGGVPWVVLGSEIETLDREASVRVWTWMSGNMRQCGISAGRA